MKLSECVFGTLVQTRPDLDLETGVGMVMGITQNVYQEAVPLVLWQHEDQPRGYNHNNLVPYQD